MNNEPRLLQQQLWFRLERITNGTHCKNYIVNDSVLKEYIHLIYKIYTSPYNVNQFLYGLSKGYYQYSVIKVDAKRQIRLFLKESKEKIGV